MICKTTFHGDKQVCLSSVDPQPPNLRKVFAKWEVLRLSRKGKGTLRILKKHCKGCGNSVIQIKGKISQ